MIALAFHQAFEGLGLGCFIADPAARFSATKKAAMVCTFVFTCPVGIWGGVALADASRVSNNLFTIGALDGVTGGMLLYMALMQFIAEDFSRSDVLAPNNLRLRLKMYLSLLSGAVCMTMIGAWS